MLRQEEISPSKKGQGEKEEKNSTDIFSLFFVYSNLDINAQEKKWKNRTEGDFLFILYKKYGGGPQIVRFFLK